MICNLSIWLFHPILGTGYRAIVLQKQMIHQSNEWFLLLDLRSPVVGNAWRCWERGPYETKSSKSQVKMLLSANGMEYWLVAKILTLFPLNISKISNYIVRYPNQLRQSWTLLDLDVLQTLSLRSPAMLNILWNKSNEINNVSVSVVD